MPSDPIIPNCVEVRLKWLSGSIVFLNVLHAQYTIAGPLNPTVGESLFAAVKASAGMTSWLADVPPQTHFTGMDVRDLRTPNNPVLLSTGLSVSGTPGVAAAPRQNAIVVSLKTAFSGRQFRGRVYMGGLGINTIDVTTGEITATANTDAVAFINAVKTALSGQSMTLAIGQHHLPPRPNKAGETLPDRPANVVPVTQVVALNTRPDTQRRRLQ